MQDMVKTAASRLMICCGYGITDLAAKKIDS
jgi:hypothetical protein